ncbi:MAG TPA: DNA polymerase III subunit alpha [Actinomycetes bacterium]
MASASGSASRSDPFVHLHVASGYSMQYGASHPEALVARAAEHGQRLLALTDRDGVYGAVKFAKACLAAGITPVLGVDLAVMPVRDPSTQPARLAPRRRRAPARGGADVDPRHPRVVLLARGRAGWAALNRLVSATHLGSERGRPVSTLDLVAEHAAGGHLLVLLGPASELGRALAGRRPDLATAVLDAWRARVDPSQLLVEVVSHRGPVDSTDPAALSTPQAARMLGFARDAGIGAVLTNAVRYAEPAAAVTADVLDAARRLVALDLRHIDRSNAEGHLKSGAQMRAVAADVVRAGSAGESEPAAVRRLLETTVAVATACALDPYADLGLSGVFFPELAVVDGSGRPATAVLRERCEAGLARRYGSAPDPAVRQRLDAELGVIEQLGYPTYFLTVADVVDLIRSMDVRVAARGSGAGSLVNYLLGISGVDPMAHGLLMERFLSPLRQALPDIDIDVESARRTEVYERILARFGGERCVAVSMMDTYRVRHAIRDVGAALGLPPGEIDSLAKAFPHIRARDARAALNELPELRASRIGALADGGGLERMFALVERLDGLPRHVALHPCGVLLSDATLLDRTPVEASWLGFPMSQFDKDDVEDLGLLKLDVLGIRMQSAMAHAVGEVARVDGEVVDIDAVPLDDEATFALVRSAHTLGCFQIESPGQRELVGKFGPETFGDLITDISLFRPGPVKSDMVTPFLRARQGWEPPQYLHPDLEPALAETCGVVVFHEQVMQVIAVLTGCTLAEADEARRSLGSPQTQPEVREWFYPLALGRGYPLATVERVWEVLRAFASFGFCKAHAAAFALPTYQSAWLKAHHPAAFLAGVLTHDPGMYPKRLILDDARQLGIAVLPLDVNASDACYRVEKVGLLDEPPPQILGAPPRPVPAVPGLPDARAYGIRLALADVKGISDAEVARVVAGRPYRSLADFWARAQVSRPVTERLVVAGAFDSVYGIGAPVPVRRRGQVTRRDLLLQVAELERYRPVVAGSRAVRATLVPATRGGGRAEGDAVVAAAARQSQAPAAVRAPDVQLAFDLGPGDGVPEPSGLPEMTGAERVRAELDVLGLDASRHVVDFYAPFLDALGVTRSRELLQRRSQAEVLVAGVKVATQTPPIRSGRRVVFLTLDDSTGPVDATFFEDAQGPYAATVFHSWLLVVRGVVRRTGPRGVSVRATGAWELTGLFQAYEVGGLEAVRTAMAESADESAMTAEAVAGAAESRSTRPVVARAPGGDRPLTAGGMGQRRVLVHPSGFRQSPYADVGTPGDDVKRGTPPRKLWHASPGSPGQ